MEKTKLIIAILLAFACLKGVANAGLIDLGIRQLTSPLGSPSEEANFIRSDQGLSSAPTYLNKFEYGSGWTGGGVLGSSYFQMSPNSGTTANATVTWDLTGTGYGLQYILVKNGRSQGFNLYHLYGVTADSAQSGSGEVTINGAKGISHISLFGANSIAVPEGGTTAALLGLAMSGLWFARRVFAT